MDTKTIFMCVIALLLGMLIANMLKDVCGCKNIGADLSIHYKCNKNGKCIQDTCILQDDNCYSSTTCDDKCALTPGPAVSGLEAKFEKTVTCVNDFLKSQGPECAVWNIPGDNFATTIGNTEDVYNNDNSCIECVQDKNSGCGVHAEHVTFFCGTTELNKTPSTIQ